jgi:hypothetical protein
MTRGLFMFRSRSIWLVVSLFLLSGTGFTQDLYTVLKPKLEGAMLELRTPAPEVQLTYDATGTLKHPSKHGLRSIDGLLMVKKIKVEDTALSIEAERLALVWNQKEQRVELLKTSIPVYVSIDLPGGNSIPEDLFAQEFYKIFVDPKEAAERACTGEEEKSFAQYASQHAYSAKKKKGEGAELPLQICFPGGNRVMGHGKGMHPPKVIKAEDPHYSTTASRSNIQGTNIFAVAIDDKGLLTDALMVRALEPTLNYESLIALRNWTFHPAMFNDKPVACTVAVEINYRLGY